MKVEEYVRTKWGYICKIVNINDFREPSMKYGVEASYLKDIMFIGDEDIIKSSPNIIDLIEVGDYVNGHYVFDKINGAIYIEDYTNKMAHIPYTKDNIQSVLTKEQFEAIKYEIK